MGTKNKKVQVSLPLDKCYELLLHNGERAKLDLTEHDKATNTIKWLKKIIGIPQSYITAILEPIGDKETRISVSVYTPGQAVDPFGLYEQRFREILDISIDQAITTQKGHLDGSFDNIYNETSQESPKSSPAKIFLSYRRKDSADVVGRIFDRLTQHYSKDTIFRDIDAIPLGIDFRKHIQATIEESRILLAIIGDKWLHTVDSDGNRQIDAPNDFVRIEIELALHYGIPVIPLLVSGARIPSEADLPVSIKDLSYRNGIQIRPDPDFHTDMNRLIAGLDMHLKTK